MDLRISGNALYPESAARAADVPRVDAGARLIRGERAQDGTVQYPGWTAGDGTRRRDSVLLTAGDVSTAVNEGYLDVDGERLYLSDKAVQAIKKAWENAEALNAAIQQKNAMEQNMYQTEEQIKAAKEAADELITAMKIFARIAKGGRVPRKDENFLREKFPELYTMAKNMAILAKKHKKHKSLLKDEEEEETTPPEGDNTVYGAEASVSAEGGDAAGTEAGGADAGGGEAASGDGAA